MREEWYCFLTHQSKQYEDFNVGFILRDDPEGPVFSQTLPDYTNTAWDGVYEYLTSTEEVPSTNLFTDIGVVS